MVEEIQKKYLSVNTFVYMFFIKAFIFRPVLGPPKRKVQVFPIYPWPHTGIVSYIMNIPHQNVYSLELVIKLTSYSAKTNGVY